MIQFSSELRMLKVQCKECRSQRQSHYETRK